MSPDASIAESSRDCVRRSAQLISRAEQLIERSEDRVAAFWECRRRLGFKDSPVNHIGLPRVHGVLDRTLTKTLPLAPPTPRHGPAEPPSRVTLGLPTSGPSG